MIYEGAFLLLIFVLFQSAIIFNRNVLFHLIDKHLITLKLIIRQVDPEICTDTYQPVSTF